MRPRRLTAVAGAVSGRLVGEDAEVTRVVVDSREAGPGDLFVALEGERTDGHAHVGEAIERGAAGALVARPGDHPGPVVVVRDTRRALLDLAAADRAEGAARVVGITGSTGKTSVKDMAASVLDRRYKVAASPGSFNTEIGVPLTLLGAAPDAEVIVCEMGSRGPGHIALVAEVAGPSVGVVTNVGPAHVGMFGSEQAVAEAKAELVEALPRDGVAVLNADDEVVRGFVARTSARPLLFGFAADAHVRGTDLRLDALGRASFRLHTPDAIASVALGVPGEHMAANALAAAAVGVALGVGSDDCADGLRNAQVSAWRMDVEETPGGVLVLNDAYNANPVSMAAALRTARWMAAGGRCVAVLGEMAELGTDSRWRHERIGELAARLGIDTVITVGATARGIAVGAAREGIEPERIVECVSLQEAEAAARERAGPGDVVLVKGSRVAGLERLARALLEPEGAPAP